MSVVRPKRRLENVLLAHTDLMVARSQIQLREEPRSSQLIE